MAVYNRMPWMCAQRDNNNVQEKTTQNLLELIRPVRFYATVDSVLRVSGEINLPKEGSTVSMKPKEKIFDHWHKGGVRLESLESSKDTQEGKNESSAETDTLEMDKLQMMRLSGIVKTFKITVTRLADAESSTKDRLLLPVDRSDKVTCTKLQSFIEELKRPIYFTTPMAIVLNELLTTFGFSKVNVLYQAFIEMVLLISTRLDKSNNVKPLQWSIQPTREMMDLWVDVEMVDELKCEIY
ncbi:hypothetical protein Bca52824_087269 [Brassica carinata]|uniref:Uncharacterized protein n=1 Tax=Brassica carinata TaxID=52824 RepID=A0A8X7TPQ0_BRACI|nr:hypothetical protein Bca52824_087269 [Brassica carinata]